MFYCHHTWGLEIILEHEPHGEVGWKANTNRIEKSQCVLPLMLHQGWSLSQWRGTDASHPARRRLARRDSARAGGCDPREIPCWHKHHQRQWRGGSYLAQPPPLMSAGIPSSNPSPNSRTPVPLLNPGGNLKNVEVGFWGNALEGERAPLRLARSKARPLCGSQLRNVQQTRGALRAGSATQPKLRCTPQPCPWDDSGLQISPFLSRRT